MKKHFKALTAEEHHVLIDKGTERPFTGEYNTFFERGTYHCKQCGAALYRSEDKFSSHCGWPSFDDAIPDAILYETDADGRRTEIMCAACRGHLGHVFMGEQFTEKNTRHCVNSISLHFVGETAMQTQSDRKTAYFAGGCFWGMEHLMQQQPGVLDVVSGYMGGHTENPTYRGVCANQGGHIEAVAVTYDPTQIDFKTLTRFFFEIHDPTQIDGQGPDIGEQYVSAIFCHDETEQQIAAQLISTLKGKGYDVVTRLLPICPFWPAEDNHQDYYEKRGGRPYCHRYQKRF